MKKDNIPSAAVAVSYGCKKLDEFIDSENVNMQDKKGYFYFQKRDKKINKINYMRWPNAWMFYGMSYWIKYSNE